MMYKKKGQLFVISAPSGAGKSTLCTMMLEEHPNLSYSVSYTTRLPRGNEVNGVSYHFVSEEVFRKMADKDEFLEYAKVHGHFYGTSRKFIQDQIEQGKDIILDIDTQGGSQLKSKAEYGAFIFIAPPSLTELRRRLELRNDTTQSLELRMKNAVSELACIPDYDYVIVNDDLKKAYDTLSCIYNAEKAKTQMVFDFNQLIYN